MPELRKDPVIGRWVIVATERSKRPDHFSEAYKQAPDDTAECPFCEGREASTPAEICAVRHRDTAANAPGWNLRVVPSISPFLRIEGELDRRGKGLYDVMNGIGAHEVVVETSRHVANMADLPDDQIARVIDTYVKRIEDLQKDKRFKYILVFKNYGWSSGGGNVRHTRSQLIATPITPKRVKEELLGAKLYYEYHERCVFCDIIKQETAAKDRIILDLDGFIAVSPFAARFPFEIWILPKKHSCDFINMDKESQNGLAMILRRALLKLKVGLHDPPYNFVIHTAPVRHATRHGGYWKTIEHDYHWHLEIIPRLTRVAGFEWGTGFYICPVPPEDSAKFLRAVKEG